MSISAFHIDELPSCLALIADAWNPQTAQQAQDDLRSMFTKSRFAPFYYVYKFEGRTVGMAGYISSWKNWGIYDLLYVATFKRYRQRGIATSLVKRCLEDIDSLDGNTMLTTYMPHFYERFGFEVIDDNLMCAGKKNFLMRRQCLSQRPSTLMIAER